MGNEEKSREWIDDQAIAAMRRAYFECFNLDLLRAWQQRQHEKNQDILYQDDGGEG